MKQRALGVRLVCQQNKTVTCGKSNVSQNTRLIDRTTETLLTLKKSHKEESKLPPNSKIQDTDIHWFPFDPVRDLSHLLTVKKFLLHSTAKFLCERQSSILKTAEIVSHSSSANSTSNPDRASSF